MTIQATVRRNLRWVLAGTWVILMAAGIFANKRLSNASTRKAGWTAVRDLPARHQLRDVDLRARDGNDGSVSPPSDRLIGRHLTSARKKGQLIDTTDVSIEPLLDRPSGTPLYLYPLTGQEAALTHMVEIGDSVRICGSPDSVASTSERNPRPPCSSALAIAALHRTTRAAPGDWLLLNMSTSANDDAVRSLAAGRRFIIVVPRSP